MNNSIIRPIESSLAHQHSSGHSPAPNSDGPGVHPDRCPSARRRPAGQPNHSRLRAAKANKIKHSHSHSQMKAASGTHLGPRRPRSLVAFLLPVGVRVGALRRPPPRRLAVVAAAAAVVPLPHGVLHGVDGHVDQPLDETLHRAPTRADGEGG